MKYKLNNIEIRRIVLIAIIHFALAIFYSYLKLGSESIGQSDSIKYLANGIAVEDSTNLFLITLYAVPKCVLLLWVINDFVDDLKTNFVYIFLRTSNRTEWLNATVIKSIISIFYYEIVFGVCVVALLVCKGTCGFSGKILIPLGCEFAQMLMLALLSNTMQLYLSSTTCVFGTIFAVGIPVIITGVVYENNGMWEYLVRFIPFNWGNYNYMVTSKVNMAIMFAGICAMCILIYIILKWKINKYELM